MKRVAGDLRRRGVEAGCWSRESVTYCEWEEVTSANVRDIPLSVGAEVAAAAAAAAASSERDNCFSRMRTRTVGLR